MVIARKNELQYNIKREHSNKISLEKLTRLPGDFLCLLQE